MPELRVHRGLFNLATLEEAYQSIVYGYDEPDILRCSEKMRMKIQNLFGRFNLTVPPEGKFYCEVFNNARITVDKDFPENKVRFENSHYQDNEQQWQGITLWTKMNIEVEFVDG